MVLNSYLKPFHQPIYVTRPLLPDLALIQSKLQEVWDSKWLTNNGPQHAILEQRLCNVLKVPYLSLFNNGTIALIVACQSLKLSGEVITTPFTFPATPHVLTWNGIRPVFCDISPATMNIDSDKIEELITPQTTGILAVHVFGTPCDVSSIQEIADRHGLRVVYDAAHAFGTEIDGRGIGTFGDISMFSFHATKLFHTGEGGALSFNDGGQKPIIDLLKNFGIRNEEEVIMPGINGKMSEMQAILGIVMLDYIEDEKKKRKNLCKIYSECLKGVEGITCLDTNQPNIKHSFQYFVIGINEKLFGRSRDYVYEAFKEFNVFARKYFYPLCSDYDCYKHLPSSNSRNLTVASQASKEVLCLPLYGGLASVDVEQICRILINIQKR